jgi:hypothetical protein
MGRRVHLLSHWFAILIFGTRVAVGRGHVQQLGVMQVASMACS